MKKLLLFTLLLAMCFVTAYSQDVSINITNFESVSLGQRIPIKVKVCNEDPAPITAPANRLRPQLSVSPNVKIVEVTDPDGGPLTGSSIIALNEMNATILFTVELENADCKEFYVIVEGVTVSDNQLFNATLGFQGPQTPGNNVANDNSPSGIKVTKPLPVTLVSFKAEKEGNLVQLDWSTTEETNSDRFEVERSANGNNWQKIGVVRSHGESNVLRNYPFSDEVPLAGLNYYRLKMIDRDATYEYSRIVSAEFTGNWAAIYPNPSSGSFRINEKLNISSLEVTNISGQVIPSHLYTIKEDNRVESEALAPGLYLIKIKQTNGTLSVHKLMVSK